MNFTAPDRAPARDDLPWLRRRTTRTAAPAGVSPPAGRIDYSASRRAVHPAPRQASASLDLDLTPNNAPPPSQPQTNPDLDLSSGNAAPPASQTHASADLDLSSGNAPPPASPPQAGTNLDLSSQNAVAPAGPARAEPSMSAPDDEITYQAARTRDGLPTILTTKEPVVTLTRVQSGVGALTIEAVISDSVGDLMLGCAYQLVSGQSSLIHHGSGLRVAPPGSRRPVIIAAGGFRELTVDLAQNRELERLVVIAYSGSGAALSWDGTLVMRTYGGARIEVPLQREPGRGVLVPLSLYNIDGEFVLRAEQSLIGGSLREATAAFGFAGISWLDDDTALS